VVKNFTLGTRRDKGSHRPTSRRSRRSGSSLEADDRQAPYLLSTPSERYSVGTGTGTGCGFRYRLNQAMIAEALAAD
jgi:hypothetical protein